MTEKDIAAALVETAERAQTKSAAVLRRMMYKALAELGVDVQQLSADAAKAERQDKEAAIERAEKRRKLLESKLANGQLEPEQVPAARRALERAPDNIKAQRAALKKFAERPAFVWPTAPTPERRKQAGVSPVVEIAAPAEGPIPALKRHRYDWPVDMARDILTLQEYDVAARLRNAYYTKQPRSAISSYGDGGRGGSPSTRVPMAERQEAAARDFNALFTVLPYEVKLILRVFVLEEPLPGHSRAPTPAEFGMEYGRCKDARRAKGVADGALKTALATLLARAQAYDQWKAQKRREQQRRVA